MSDNLELAFTLAFDLEIIVRIVGHLPDWKGFFSSGYHNSFDLILAIITTVIQIPPIPSTVVYSWLTIFQLMRWYRVVIVVPRMRPLLVSAMELDKLKEVYGVWQFCWSPQFGHLLAVGNFDCFSCRRTAATGRYARRRYNDVLSDIQLLFGDVSGQST